MFLEIGIFFYCKCKGYSDLFESYSDALSILVTFCIIWPGYLYVSIILSDRALLNFSKLYVRALSLCSPRALNELKEKREVLKEKIKILIEKYGPEIFPSLKEKNRASTRFDFNESINDAFGFLSEIGFN